MVAEVEYPKWPHVERLNRHTDDLLVQPEWLTITEKIDGFNARFGRTSRADGAKFWIGSRNQVVEDGKNLQGFYEWAEARQEGIPPGYTFFGEWAGKGIQRRIDYGEPAFWLFAIRQWAGGRNELPHWHDRIVLTNWSQRLRSRIVPVLYDGPAAGVVLPNGNVSMITKFAEDNPGIEGIVIVGSPMMYDVYGNPLILKHVNPTFSELRSQRMKKPPPDITHVSALVEEYATPERLDHVLSLVRELVVDDPLDPKHTGEVLRLYYQDVEREAARDIEKLEDGDKKLIGKVLNRFVKPMLEDARDAALA